MFTYGIPPDFRGGVHLFIFTAIRHRASPEFIGSRNYYVRRCSLPRVHEVRARKPQGSSKLVTRIELIGIEVRTAQNKSGQDPEQKKLSEVSSFQRVKTVAIFSTDIYIYSVVDRCSAYSVGFASSENSSS